MDTAKGGFYVNKGKLEFKSRHEELDESDLSDIEDQPQKKGKKRMIGSGDEGADTESISDPNITVEKTIAPSRPPTISIPTTKARMTGAPPTKRFAHSSHGESPNQRAANAIKKKRLVGMPPTFAKKKSLQNAVNQREDEMFGFLRDMAGGEIPEVDDDIVEVVSASALQGPANKETVTSTVSSPLPTVITENAIPSTSNSGKENMNVLSSPQKKRSLAPMTDTLAKMIDNFKKVTQGLSVPGQKKRLQNSHVDMVIATMYLDYRIEEQCMKDGYTVHEKARVSQTLADFCGIQKGSLYARCMKRKEDNKAAIASTSSPPRPPSSGIINKNIGSNLTAQASVLPQKAAQSILANFLNHPGINRQVIVMLREKIDSGEIGYDEFVKLQPLILTQTQKQSSNGITKVNTSGSSCTTGSSNVAPTSTHNQLKCKMNENAEALKRVAAYMASDVLDYFQKQIKMSRLFIEFGRRNPDKLVVLTSPIVKESFERDGIDLNRFVLSICFHVKIHICIIIFQYHNATQTTENECRYGSSPLSATSIPNNALTGLSQAQLTEVNLKID
uniref:ERCC4 domain-containing protein n=1 Tax=Heterorhabditis bacteriophora TaxID=37862 RepID=A0A1I7XQ33_HETBA